MPGCRLRKEAKGRGEGDGVRRRSLRHWGVGRPQPVPPLQHLTLTLERGKKSVGGWGGGKEWREELSRGVSRFFSHSIPGLSVTVKQKVSQSVSVPTIDAHQYFQLKLHLWWSSVTQFDPHSERPHRFPAAPSSMTREGLSWDVANQCLGI